MGERINARYQMRTSADQCSVKLNPVRSTSGRFELAERQSVLNTTIKY